jgi:hypothetical protein
MTDQTNAPETEATAEATPAPVRTRAPALTATVDGVSHKLLKYAFPTKAIPFTLNVNGVEAHAAVTAGRGASYTYLLINNTGFYLPKDVVLEAGAGVEINFPDGYSFDETQAVRVSTYKPKAKRVATEGEVADDIAAETGEYTEQEVAEEQVADEAPKRASRKGKSK